MLRWWVVLFMGLFVLTGLEGRGADPGVPPDGWQSQAIREELAPRFWVVPARAGDKSSAYCLGIGGQGNEAVDGRWLRTVPVTAGKHYVFRAECRAKDVATPTRSVLARVVWLDAQGKQVIPPEYPFTSSHPTSDGWQTHTSTYQAPPQSAQARLELHFRWSARGEVLWRSIALKETDPPAARKVRLAAVNHRPRGTRSPQVNLDQFVKQIEEAAKRKADIVCLPEGITVVGTGKKYAEVAEPIPGPATTVLGDAARKHRLHVVAGLYESDGRVIYNTSVLIGRDGQLLGKYRKVCLPREEIDGGITPGKDYPVFDTDFGRVGMMICWDVHFPEVARELAARGAEVILMPIWGGNETLARARAIENQVYLVTSGYDFRTTIYDKAGQPVATTDQDPEVILADVDLNERKLWPWLGEWRARIWREGPVRTGEFFADASPAPRDRAAAPAGKQPRVLILSGIPETHHDYKNQCPNLQKVLQQRGHEVVLRDRAIIEEGDGDKFDVVVLMSEKWRGDEKNRQQLLQLVRDGKGLAVIHMAYVPCVEALGGRASRNGKTGDLKIEIVDRKHPVTAGLEDFTAGPRDELYAGVKFTVDDVHVLARGQDTLGTWEPIAWVRSYGKGRVFYTSLGHSTPSQQNAGFIKLVTQGVNWVGEPKP